MLGRRTIAAGAVAAAVAVAWLPMLPTLASGPTVASYVSHAGAMSIAGASSVADAVNTPDDEKFVQMDNVSEVVVVLPAGVNAEPDGTSAFDLEIDTYDLIFPACAELSGSIDGATWFPLDAGVDSSHPACPDTPATDFSDVGDVLIDLDAVGQGPVHWVRVVQNGYIDPAHPGLGFDLDAVLALNTTPLPPPPPPPANDGTVKISGKTEKGGANGQRGAQSYDGLFSTAAGGQIDVNYKTLKVTCSFGEGAGTSDVDAGAGVATLTGWSYACSNGATGTADLTLVDRDVAPRRGTIAIDASDNAFDVNATALDTGNIHVDSL